jgi:hypothetical protein
MQTLALLFLMGVGVVVCVLSARALVVHWRLPWREALMYFGIVPYPHESAPARRDRR